jgi:ABC-type glycerol-3-phosphate transport system substrate-binding protein
VRRALVPLAIFGLGACHGAPDAPRPIRFLHTFNPAETELFNATMAQRGIAVESSLVPFARGQQVINEILRAGKSCPDLIRIDATWLPELVGAHLLAPPPDALAKLDWSDEAAQLAQQDGRWWGVPQAVDGLVVVRDVALPAPASPALADLVRAARAARTPAAPAPLGVRVDAYWFVPWLRAEGGELAPHGIDGDGAPRALAEFAALFGPVGGGGGLGEGFSSPLAGGGVAAPPPSAGSEAPDELRRWAAHEVAYWVTGPWQLGGLQGRDRIAVSPIAHAPRGGQLLVVPTCAPDAAAGWELAAELTSVEVELIFSDAFATVPTRRAALASATPLVHAIDAALATAEPLPRSPVTPLLFDDLNPALAAVVAGDATAGEAIEGVRRGWRRLVPP